jgi:transposase InsO family protein
MKSKDKLTKEETKLLRYNIIAPILSGNHTESSRTAYFQMLSEKGFETKFGTRHYSVSTMQSWYASYMKSGFEGLLSKTRKDKGKQKKMDEILEEAIISIISHNIKITNKGVYRKLIEMGHMTRKYCSQATIDRYISKSQVRKQVINKSEEVDDKQVRERRPFTVAHANMLWQGDTTFGLYLTKEDRTKQSLCIIGFLDDYSRKVTVCKIFHRDTTENVMHALKLGIKENGVPKAIYVDNGSPYTNAQLNQVCANLGVQLINTRPYSPQSKGKLERFWGTLKMNWLRAIDWKQFKTISELQESLNEYIWEYNNTNHSVTMETPQERFLKDYSSFRYEPIEYLDKVFLFKEKRRIGNDGVIRLNNREYQIHSRYAGQRIEFSYMPEDPSIVYAFLEGKWQSFKLVDRKANGNNNRGSTPVSYKMKKDNEDVRTNDAKDTEVENSNDSKLEESNNTEGE